MKEERDFFDDLIRSRLQNVEADTNPDDWKAIADRLSSVKVVAMRRRLMGWAAAIALLIAVSGSFYLFQFRNAEPPIAQTTESNIQEPSAQPPSVPQTIPQSRPVISEGSSPVRIVAKAEKVEREAVRQLPELRGEQIQTIKPETMRLPQVDPPAPISTVTVETKSAKAPSRKWGFGTGIGGLTEGSGNVVNTYVLRSNSNMEDEKLLSMNALTDGGKEPKTNIKHKTPVSFGLSVSRQLNDRFSLQTGVFYSLHKSSWETNASVYNKEIDRRLHFIGIPLSLNYKIAEWNKLQVYASGGVQAEINVAGRESTKNMFREQVTDKEVQTSYTKESVRMKEWQWSVDARAGISYPVIRFISIYAEVGAAYYFDNGSETETIYSDKPFNVSPQIGLRLGF